MSSMHATVTLIGTDRGGRTSPITSGYRPQFYFDGKDWECRSIDFDTSVWLYPGETRDATVTLSKYAARHLFGKLNVGDEFELREGNKVVGRGTVTRLID